jgi:CheY-like chemotaxis protein
MTSMAYSKLRVLVIVEESFSLELTCALLRSLGIGTVIACEDAATGLDMVERIRPDLVLCDARPLGMDGPQFLRQVRTGEGEGPHRTPIVLLIGDRAVDTALFTDAPAVDGFLSKPVDRNGIREQIAAVVAADAELFERLSAC